MADRLTQLQDSLDLLNTQMFASLNYVHTRHPYGDIPGQPSQVPHSAGQEHGAVNGDAQQGEGQTGGHEPGTPTPETADAFIAGLRELAQDLVIQEQKIEMIVRELPGINSSQSDQERRMRELEAEMRIEEEKRTQKEVERQKMVELLGEVIGKVKRVP